MKNAPLDEVEYLGRIESLVYSSGSERGHDVSLKRKPNQDAALCIPDAFDRMGYFFAVFDGHGPAGHLCAEFAKNHLSQYINDNLARGLSLSAAIKDAHQKTNSAMVTSETCDSRLSGTTAVTLFLEGTKFTVSNVGDSRCILGIYEKDTGVYRAAALTNDQTTARSDEQARLQACGAKLMTVAQRDDSLSNPNDTALRVWVPGTEKQPGCEFTRSIGDSLAKSIGVTAEPEVMEIDYVDKDAIFALVSDGVTQYMSDDEIMQLIAKNIDSPADAVSAIIRQAAQAWKEKNDMTYIDDITATVIFLSPPKPQRSQDCIAVSGSRKKESVSSTEDLGCSTIAWTLGAGFCSGFLGGLCGIPGPPILLYFMYPPHPVSFNKHTQRACGVTISFVNVTTRMVYYVVSWASGESDELGNDRSATENVVYFFSIILSSIIGVLIGEQLFKLIEDSRTLVKSILTALLLVAGVSLLISSIPNL
jgi:serine/threonine protein phosphatase PrpC